MELITIITIVLLVLSIGLNVFLYIGFMNSSRLNQQYEETILNIREDMQETLDQLRVVDLNGAFEADDEVGFVFEYILNAIETLNKKYNPEYDEPERDKEEKERGLERVG